MRNVFVLALLIAGAWTVPGQAEPLDFSQSDSDAVAAAEIAMAESLAEARDAGSPTSVHAIKYDMNDDGTPETVGRIDSAYLCGGMGSCFFVVAESGSSGNILLSVPGVDSAEILGSVTDGWHDIQFNGETVWRWNGDKYDLY